MNTAKVAMYMRTLTVQALINKARLVTQRVTDNPTEFADCAVLNARVIQDLADLEAAFAETNDGAKSKTAYMHDMQQKLIRSLMALGHLIEIAANGDEAVVHLAGLDVIHRNVPVTPIFKVEQGAHAGSVKMRIKARKEKTHYKWEHSSDAVSWISDGITSACRTTIDGLAKGVYWFRIVLIDGSGEHEEARLSFAVN